MGTAGGEGAEIRPKRFSQATLRAIWQQALPVFVREFNTPATGPSTAVTLLYLSLGYRVTSLLLAPSKDARLAHVATGFEPPVRTVHTTRSPRQMRTMRSHHRAHHAFARAASRVPAGSAEEQCLES